MEDTMSCPIPSHQQTEHCVAAMLHTHEPNNSTPAGLAAEVPCLYARIAHRIIRLRCQSHADWDFFRGEIEANLDAILCDVDSGWLLSICDAFADYGDPIERRNALCVSILFNWGILAPTQRFAHVSLDGHAADPQALAALQKPLPLCDGMIGMMNVHGVDLLPNLFGRLTRAVRETPIVHRIMKTLYERIKGDPRSTLAKLARNHPLNLFTDIETAMVSTSACDADAPRGAPASANELTSNQEQSPRLDDRIARIESAIEELSKGFKALTTRSFVEKSRSDEVRDRDLLERFGRQSPIAPAAGSIVTENMAAAADPRAVAPQGSADDLVTQGEQLYASGDLAQAAQRFLQAVQVTPNQIDAWNNLAVLLAEQGEVDTAIQCLNAALAIDPDCAAAHGNLAILSRPPRAPNGTVHARLETDELGTGDADKQSQICDWREQGERSFEAGDLDTAFACFERALQAQPRDPECLNDMGVCLWAKGDSAQAMLYFARGMEYAPHDRNLVLNAGHVLAEGARTNDALALYRSFLEDFAGDDEVERRVAQLIKVAPPPELAATSAGEEYYARGDIAGARRAFEQALEHSPDHVDALNNLGVLFWHCSEHGRALEYLRRALECSPTHPDTLRNLAVVLQALGEHETAGLLVDARHAAGA